MKKEIAITWHIEDVRMQMDNRREGGEELPVLNDKQLCEILADIERGHDATIGVNWDVIDYHIDRYLRDKLYE